MLRLMRSSACDTPLTPLAAFTVLCATVGVALTWLVRPEYRRQKAEEQAGLGRGGEALGLKAAAGGEQQQPTAATPLLKGGLARGTTSWLGTQL